jgi:RNA polymerase sigma factor (sigma-70 family)
MPQQSHHQPESEQNYLHGRDAGFWLSCPAMDDLIKLVKTYRLTAGVADRLRLAEEIFRLIEPDLRLFVFKAIRPPAAEDVLQEVLKAAATGMKNFAGGSNEQFWAWCYRIARNKLNDHFPQARPPTVNSRCPRTNSGSWWNRPRRSRHCPQADRHDLEYAMKLLTASKPECYDYLWKHFVFGLAYGEIAEEQNLSYDNVRMKIGRCLDEAKSLVS